MKTLDVPRFLTIAFLSLPFGLFAIDTDNDGLDDSVETNTGVYVSLTNTGTNPNLADSDADGAGDWYEVAIIDINPSSPQPNAPNNASLKPNVPYPLPTTNATPPATNKPVKVFILSGQSNMVGQGEISPLGTAGTLNTITRNEKKFPNLLNGAGWSVRNDVNYRGVIAAVAKAPLTPGQGGAATTIGPELGFGHVMGYYHDEPVLVIKASDGGKSLGGDFLPPGSVQYTSSTKTYPGFGQSPASWDTGSTPIPDPAFYGGIQFDKCFRHEADWAPAGAAFPAVTNVADVLDNFATEYPEYAAQGFVIAGFGWFQGWNDGLSYTKFYADRYEQNMAQFIRQIRSYYVSRYPLNIAPKAPFVIATCAFEGWNEAYLNQYPTRRSVINAQLAVGNPTLYPEFAGNVKTMEARGYWRDKAVSPSPGGNQGFHYNRSAETFMLVGDALGRGMIDLLNTTSVPDTTPPAISTTSPADNATGVAVDSNLTVTFNESIALGTGSITLKNLTDVNQSVITITDATQVSIAGAVLTINPTLNLIAGKSYAVWIGSSAIKDLSNNLFLGIANDTTWNFTTVIPDTTAPTIVTHSPADNATSVSVGTNFVVTFSESIALGNGNITIKNLTASTQSLIAITDATQVSLSGSVLTINPTANLAGSNNYVIQIAATAIKDLSNNPFAGIADDTTWNFTTAAPPVSGTITVVNQASGFLGSSKTQVTTEHAGTTLLTYDATGVDKLVFTIGCESGFNGGLTNITAVTFNGDALTGAVEENSQGAVGKDSGTAEIWYLDNPDQVADGTLTISFTSTGSGLNGGVVSVVGLAGTADGAAGMGDTDARYFYDGTTTSIISSITTTSSNSLVVAMVENSGNNNSSGTPGVSAPLTLVNANRYGGSQWAGAATGYQAVPASGTTITPTFTTTSSASAPYKSIHTIAVEFLASTLDNMVPTLVSIVDDKSGGPVALNTLITYTVNFSEDMDASTFSAADFGNAGTSAITIGTITETAPGVFTVKVTPTSSGTLQLIVNAAANLTDVAGNALVTTSAISDDTTITVQTAYATWSGGVVFDGDANNDGVANGIAWLVGSANPAANAIALLPTFDNTTDPAFFIYTYRRSDAALTAPNTTIEVQYGSSLSGWTTAENDGTNVIITPTNDFYGSSPGIDKVEVKIKRTLAVDDKLFTRVKVAVTP